MPKEISNCSIQVEQSAQAAASLGPPNRRDSTLVEDTGNNDDSTGDGSMIQHLQSIKLISNDNLNPHETDLEVINQLILHLIHMKLKGAWEINNKQAMCFVFDATSLACLFKHGMKYSDKSLFLTLSREELEAGNVTETDDTSPGLMPYTPVACAWVNTFCHRGIAHLFP